VLLDTACWLWLHAEPERFNAHALALVRNPETDLVFSAASAWEIAIKYALGKLSLPLPPAAYVPSRMARVTVTALPVLHDHAVRVAELPPHHRDPFDRLLVAQCQAERLPLLSADRQFGPYQVEVIWAG
jgi:PIN domain nuclease of toxin-antitoxin system